MKESVDHSFWRGHPGANEVNSPFMDEPHGAPIVIPYRATRQHIQLVVDNDDRNFCFKLLRKIRNLINNLSGR